jgi:hypothetical protein
MVKATGNKFKKGVFTFALDLLEAIAGAYDLLPRYYESYNGYQMRLAGHIPYYSSNKISKGLHYLKKEGMIKYQKYGSAQITLAGRQKLLLAKIRAGRLPNKDGQSCIIIFDIPEEKRKYRRFIRKFLLENGFTHLQKSVLIGRSFLPKEFSELIKEWKLEPNVTIIKGLVLEN